MDESNSVTGSNQMRVLNDPEVLRLIADPLRLRILELLRQAPRTVTELAELLGLARTRLYYHVRLLESHDLITVAETHVVAGITEKRYRVTAFRFSVDKTLFGSLRDDQAPLDVLLSVILDEVATEIRRAVQSGLIELEKTGKDEIRPNRMVVGRRWYRFNDADVAEFARRYDEFQATFANQGVDDPSSSRREDDARATLYEWLIGFYPIVPPDPDPE